MSARFHRASTAVGLGVVLVLAVGCASSGRSPGLEGAAGEAARTPESEVEGSPAETFDDAPEAAEVAGASEDPYAAGDYEDLYFDDEYEETDTGDPIEPFNRGVFALNDGLDRFLLEPVATGLDWVMPDFAQVALRNAFDNLSFPIVFFNDIFQGKPRGAGQDLARFLVNSTVGLGGLMDPASEIGLPRRNEDFGQTLGYYGVPPGPYLMLPFFGPSNVRDTGGLVVDTVFRAIGFFIPFVASVAMQGIDTVNRRSLMREQIQAEREASLDWYAAVRSAYSQYRENLIHDKRREADEDGYGDHYLGASIGSDEQSSFP